MVIRKVLGKAWEYRDNKYLWFLISTGILAGLIYFADAQKFVKSIRSAKLVFLIPALVLGLAVFPIWSYVWYRVFKKSNIDLTYRESIRIFMAGNFMNSVTPLGQAGGEPLMAFLVEQNTEASYERALSSIFSADIMNGMPPITFILGGTGFLLIFGSLNDIIVQTVYMVLLATAVGGTIAYLLWFESGTIEGKIQWILDKIVEKTGRGQEIVSSIEEKLEEVEESFKTIGNDPVYLLKTAIISHVGWLMQIFNFVLIAGSLGYFPDLTPVYFIVVISGLANFSPTPGGSGTFEAAMAGLITIFIPYIAAPEALTIAILFRISTYWPGILLGWLALNSLNGQVNER